MLTFPSSINLKSTAIAVASCCLFLADARATPFVSISNIADGIANSGGGPQGEGNATVRTGTSGGLGLATVFVFELPTLDAALSSVAFDFNYAANESPNGFNVDVYGLGFRNLAAIAGTDYYAGSFGGDMTDATAIQDNVLTPLSSLGAKSLSAGGNAALLTYVNAQITAGAAAGDFLFIRLSPDFASIPSGNTGYQNFTGDASGPDLGKRPTLTFNTIPEPSSVLLLGLAGGTLLLRRRRS